MVIQSRANPVPLLMTRPAAQALVFAEELRLRFGDRLRLIATPLMAPRFDPPRLPPGLFAALILTSQTGVEAFSRLDATALGLPGHAYCVGERTAQAAWIAGLNVLGIAPDSTALKGMILALKPPGKLLHLCGQDTRGDIAKHLAAAGIETIEAVIYSQEKRALTPDAERCLKGAAPVLVPLFSPRTARLFGQELTRIVGISPLFLAAISADVAREVAGLAAHVRIASHPDAAAMLDAVDALLMDAQRA